MQNTWENITTFGRKRKLTVDSYVGGTRLEAYSNKMSDLLKQNQRIGTDLNRSWYEPNRTELDRMLHDLLRPCGSLTINWSASRGFWKQTEPKPPRWEIFLVFVIDSSCVSVFAPSQKKRFWKKIYKFILSSGTSISSMNSATAPI